MTVPSARRPLLISGERRILHGGDYNPDQWLDEPHVLEEDDRLMALSGCQTFAVGIFAWMRLEPSEGRYEFDWLDRTFERMEKGGRRVVLATPSGAKPAWMSKKYPEIRTAQYHIDILTAHFVQHPDWFDVVVASNLFGDILSDLGPAVAGSIGIAPGGNINPEKEHPSMFEPVHGSAPDIAGKGIANPIAQIWTGAMMLDHLGHEDAGRAVVEAIERVVQEGKVLTRDLGGTASTTDVGKAITTLI